MAKQTAVSSVSVVAPAVQSVGRDVLKNVALRLGLPLAGVWLFVLWLNHWAAYAVAAAVTLAVVGVAAWAWQRMNASKKVSAILQAAQSGTPQDRQAALTQLDTAFKKGDVSATLARAQLLMQDEPEKAVEVLESVDLTKALPFEADQIRFQRAMVHLVKGEVDRARVLVDPINLSRFDDTKIRAAVAAVVAEAWARTGQAKRAIDTLDLLPPDDATLGEAAPQVWRARAFAAAATNDTKTMRRALKKLATENPQLLASFLAKKVHPLLEREARQLLMQSNIAPRRVQMARR